MDKPEGPSAANIISSVASLISALAWPMVVIFMLYGIAQHADSISKSLRTVIGDSGSAKVSLPGGIAFEIIEKTASVSTNAVLKSAQKSDSPPLTNAQAAQIAANAQSTAIDLSQISLDPRKRLKVLWVDDHAENNTDLQYAFQALGIIVICIDSNQGLARAFDVSLGFDVVITDMGRDEMGNGRRQADPEGGLKTIDIISKEYPGVPVIIYADGWSETHRNDKISNTVIKITNRPQEVFQIITQAAKIRLYEATEKL